MKLKEKKTLGYAILSVLMIVLLSMYLGKTDYDKINETNRQGFNDAKDNSIKIAKKLKAYIYEVVDHTPGLEDTIQSNKIKTDKQVKNIKDFTFGPVKSIDKTKKFESKIIAKKITDKKKPISEINDTKDNDVKDITQNDKKGITL